MMVLLMSKEKDGLKVVLTGEGLNITRTVSDAVGQQIVALVLGGAAPVAAIANVSTTPVATGSSGMTAKGFMAQKRPATDMERVTCLAWFLTHEKGIGGFKTKELTELNREAAQPKLSNASATARNAVSEDYLAAAGGGQKQITARGEALVNALPDREKVKAALEAHPKARRRSPRAKKPKK
jgi:hypothetical protein